MKQLVLIIGSLYGAFSVILGAFGAHALKKVLTASQLESFEVGVRYQMVHAVVLLIIGFYFSFESKLQTAMGWSFISGTFLFSVSIYLLSTASMYGAGLKLLGPVTPLGGLLMIAGWILLSVNVVKQF